MTGEDKKGREMLKQLEKENEDLRSHLTSAMKEADFKTYQAETAERKVCQIANLIYFVFICTSFFLFCIVESGHITHIFK